MATARRRDQWDHTASVCATILNSRLGIKRADLVTPLDLHPLRKPPKPPADLVLSGDVGFAALQAIT